MPVLFHGTIMAGGIYSAANARFVPRQLAFQLRSVKPKFVLASSGNLKKALEAVSITGSEGIRVLLLDNAR